MFGGGTKERSWWLLGAGIVLAFVGAYFVWYFAEVAALNNIALHTPQSVIQPRSAVTPQTTQEVLVSGREHIWDIGFLPGGDLLFSERGGRLNLLTKEREVREVAVVSDVYVRGEGGLMGMVLDPKFTENHYVYTCFNSTKAGLDIRVVRWQLKPDASGLERRTDIVTGIESNTTGRHSGCRLAFGPDGYLWIGTGDAAKGGTAQDPKKLNGKILRVDRDGKAAKGNIGGEFDARIYSYGHRNVQGLAFFPTPRSGVPGVSVEHGSDVDDEVNPLQPGNFGWAHPAGAYNELNVPMTDLARFPDAVQSLWSSGRPTQAPSGSAIVQGVMWEGWNGAVAVAMLRAEHLKILRLDPKLKITKEEKILLDHGRLRTVRLGPDGALYVGTTNGTNDQIIRVTPS